MCLESFNENALIFGAEQAILKIVLVLLYMKTTRYKNCLHVEYSIEYRRKNSLDKLHIYKYIDTKKV